MGEKINISEFAKNKKYKLALVIGLIFLAIIISLAIYFFTSGSNIKNTINSIAEAQVGEYVTFGSYEQDGNKTNGQEEIEWLVLDKNDNQALLISKYGLDTQPYNVVYTNVTWETCSLREWLNNNFLKEAFNDKEIEYIATTNVEASSNYFYHVECGNDTQDKVFITSCQELYKYFESDDEKKCFPTKYAINNNADTDDDGYCHWWLRTPGSKQDSAVNMLSMGFYNSYGASVDYDRIVVRPMIWVNLNN